MSKGAIIEIVQRAPADDIGGGSVIIPNDIRIEGHSLYSPTDRPVTVHELAMGDGTAVLVTLTLYARRVIIGAEGDEGLMSAPTAGEPLADQIDRLADWFRANAPERIIDGGAVDVAIATLDAWLAERTSAA